MAKICIVVPTYNEKDTLEQLIARIFELKISGLEVLVVDDNSPDGTGQLAERIKAENSNVAVLHQAKKTGLGRAYQAGFAAAIKSGADYILEMDADLSHDPKQIPALLEAASQADLALGSRYVTGGGVSNWRWFRRFISWFGNIYARAVLGLPYHDLTGGFKCYRRVVLEAIDLANLSSVGYNFQIETTHKAHLAGFKIVEVPIIFVERAGGKSKFSLSIIIESFWKVLLLGFKK